MRRELLLKTNQKTVDAANEAEDEEVRSRGEEATFVAVQHAFLKCEVLTRRPARWAASW